jgi:PAS domain S-box-containing protein
MIDTILASPRFDDQEQDRIARILHIISGALVVGLLLLLIHRLAIWDVRGVQSIGAITAVSLMVVVFVHRRQITLSGNLMLWSLLTFLNYQIFTSDGIQDTAVVALPGILVMAGLILGRTHYLLFSMTTVLIVSILGILQVKGILASRLSPPPVVRDLVDIAAILTITAVTVRILADSLIGSFARARKDERELREQTKQLIASEQRYHSLFDGASDAILILQGERIVTCNRKAIVMFGYGRREEMIYLTPWDFSPLIQPNGLESRESGRSYLEAAVDGEPQSFDWMYYRKNGSEFDAEVSMTAVDVGDDKLVQTLIRDVTERKQMGQRLADSEAYYRTLVNTSPDAILIADRDGRLAFASDKAYSLFGVPATENVLGRPVTNWVAPEERLDVIHRMKDLMAGKSTSAAREYRFLKHDGTPFWCDVNASLLLDGNNESMGVLLISRDVTARKLEGERRKKLEQELFQAQKVDTIGTLAAGIAHDFNNILNIIMGNASLLAANPDDKTKFGRRISTISKVTERGAMIVRQLLTFARKANVELKSLVFNDEVKEIAKFLDETLPRNITIVLRLQEDLPMIAGDSVQINQVLMNVCLNAKDAMPHGGTLTIGTSVLTREDAKRISGAASAARYVVASIEDSGVGIEEETMRRMFDPFFTTKSVGKGTGLGLSVTRGIVDNHRGFIDVQSRPGHGTKFRILLPAVEHLEGSSRELETQISSAPGGTEMILFVEDEQSATEMVADLLRKKGYTVLTASNGKEALDVYSKYERDVSLVISDYGLPVMGGDELCRHLRNLSPQVPVIIMSGFVDPDRHALLKGLGVKEVIQKPYCLAQLLVFIRTTLDQTIGTS